jgi:hypothetical protein
MFRWPDLASCDLRLGRTVCSGLENPSGRLLLRVAGLPRSKPSIRKANPGKTRRSIADIENKSRVRTQASGGASGADYARLFEGVGGKPKVVGNSEERAGPMSAGKRGMGS